jgi:hypothetical protein
MAKKIRVTQDDIDAGVRYNCTFCPVAIALMRAGYDDPEVHSTGHFTFLDGSTSKLYLMADEVIQPFIEAFDDGDFVAPFSFTIEETKLWTRSSQ